MENALLADLVGNRIHAVEDVAEKMNISPIRGGSKEDPRTKGCSAFSNTELAKVVVVGDLVEGVLFLVRAERDLHPVGELGAGPPQEDCQRHQADSRFFSFSLQLSFL